MLCGGCVVAPLSSRPKTQTNKQEPANDMLRILDEKDTINFLLLFTHCIILESNIQLKSHSGFIISLDIIDIPYFNLIILLFKFTFLKHESNMVNHTCPLCM